MIFDQTSYARVVIDASTAKAARTAIQAINPGPAWVLRQPSGVTVILDRTKDAVNPRDDSQIERLEIASKLRGIIPGLLDVKALEDFSPAAAETLKSRSQQF
jgi:hypothetical protein